MDQIIFRFAVNLPGFLIGIVAHEWAHAYVAKKFGDNTAEMSGRLTLNPQAHIDPFGTVIFPIICIIFGGTMFGYARPVPVNARNFKKVRSGIFWVSFAGPGMNILIGIFSALMLGILQTKITPNFSLYEPLIKIFYHSIMINFILAVFNLIPFPPLDGSKMISSFLRYDQAIKFEGLAQYSFVFLLVLWFTPILNIILTPALMFGQFLSRFFVLLLS